MMDKKIRANQENALRSTGPKTPDGKSAASLNSLKHGILSRQTPLPDEDHAAFDAFAADLLKALDPVGALESLLADRIISSAWRLQRLLRAEGLVFEVARKKFNSKFGLHEDGGLGHAIVTDANGPDAFTRLSRYEASIERSLYRSLHELQRLQAARSGHGMRSGELYALEWSAVDLDQGLIHVETSYNGRMKQVKCTKAGYWRDVPINQELRRLLHELRAAHPGQQHVLPRPPQWRRGEAAKVLRGFCQGIGIPSVKFHTLRACFATHVLRSGVPPATVMLVGGWTSLKVMQHYIRLAGLEVSGATDSLPIFAPKAAMEKVVELFPGASAGGK